jgi:hypothetical protein
VAFSGQVCRAASRKVDLNHNSLRILAKRVGAWTRKFEMEQSPAIGTPRIFIGGTGRSGTTILYEALGCHKSIYSFPMEMRFLVDPDGLISLVDALTVRYSIVQSREAMFRFERLMREDLVTPQRPPFLSYDVANWLGGDYYWDRLDQFCAELVLREYSITSSPLAGFTEGRRAILGRWLKGMGDKLMQQNTLPHRVTYNWSTSRVKTIRYFADRSQLACLTAKFVDDLFLDAANRHGKETWCEKTPMNRFYIRFLQELFPNSVFVNIKRDPRGVLLSVMKQHWGPNDVQGASEYLMSNYDWWFDYLSRVEQEKHHYLELKLEDLAAEPRRTLSQIAAFCGLEDAFDDLPEFSMEKVEYWRDSMSKTHLELANQLLGPYIEKMGYEV